jgi:hypothetical protein
MLFSFVRVAYTKQPCVAKVHRLKKDCKFCEYEPMGLYYKNITGP